MKKQNKIIIGLIVGVAVIILLISFLFPSVYKGLTSGSFGKADKYRQEQMTENDIQLRSDFTKDTAQLRQMITGLIYFALFTDNLSMTIDTCLESYQLQGFDKDPANSQAIGLLRDYSSFLKNNSKTLANTTRMLAALLLRDTLSQSMDIEKNIRDFANYVNQVNRKDSVLMLALVKVDGFLIGNKTLQNKQEEIRNLKAIRDQLVIKSSQYMAMTGNKKELGVVLSYAIQSQAQFNSIGALNVVEVQSSGSLSAINSRPINATLISGISNLNVAFSAAALQAGFSASTLQAGQAAAKVNSKSDLNVIVYDKANLQMTLCSANQLNVIYGTDKLNNALQGKDPNLGIVGVFNGQFMGVVLNASVLCSVLSSTTLSAFMSADRLNEIIPARDLASAAVLQSYGSNAGLQMGFGSNAALQSVVSANSGLQSLFNSMSTMNGFNSLMSTSLSVEEQVGP
jgi:hypothetical protein